MSDAVDEAREQDAKERFEMHEQAKSNQAQAQRAWQAYRDAQQAAAVPEWMHRALEQAESDYRRNRIREDIEDVKRAASRRMRKREFIAGYLQAVEDQEKKTQRTISTCGAILSWEGEEFACEKPMSHRTERNNYAHEQGSVTWAQGVTSV